MHTLLLLRHAKSSWADPAVSDHERPLAPRGRRAAGRIAEHLGRSGIRPDLVLCSDARRTRKTLDLIRPALGASAAVELEPELYGASVALLLARIRAVSDDVASLLVIGHNPGLHDLALSLVREPGGMRDKFPTAALATLELQGPWEELAQNGARLAGYVVPRQLG